MLRALFILLGTALLLAGGLYLGASAERFGWLPTEISELLPEQAEEHEAAHRGSSLLETVSEGTPPAQVVPVEIETPRGEPSSDAADVLILAAREESPNAMELGYGFQLGAFEIQAGALPQDDIVLDSGVRIGAFIIEEPEAEAVETENTSTTESTGGAEPGVEPVPSDTSSEERRARTLSRTPRPTPARRPAPPREVPRLHSNPGMHTILTARRMIASGEPISGSCFRYISTVFERAGHEHWRRRRVVFRGSKDGDFADLSIVRPGDWLYIVRYPDQTPVGTHSVLFVGWEDRASGRARVISHPGWGRPHPGAERTYDISRTYRVIRPTTPSQT